ncbi:DUF5000 domain-containing lipoprotein [Fulvivirga ligni]|uniref:DUF5000 domain-containing lipoprotein n=1 Tax=Fulvivirga ligni TaxID=2904246 RepID=UPI001F28408D|nr:DUF5000 domain-containing lipoprotein [Fulvivirga ligni]UII21460.1 DUF4959 domain-containing protein [Fulvivirga ligni]
MKYLFDHIKNIGLAVFMIAIVMIACDESEERGIPFDDGSVPGPVSEPLVENIPGGATITYSLPDSENVLYVEAEYSRKGDGETATQKSSYYNNSITILGFPDTNEHSVLLRSVTRSGKKSEPVSVLVKPQTPPVHSALANLEVGPTFGGIFINFLNESKADLKINVVTTDSLDDFYIADTYYTKRTEGTMSVRGFDSLSRVFGVYIRDRWDNYSDTLFTELKPYYEEKIDSKNFQVLELPGDNWMPNPLYNLAMPLMWDNDPGTFFGSNPGAGFPQAFAFDLGVTTTLARMKYFPRSDGVFAYSNQPRFFEIWGSNDPNPDGSWDSWSLLLECEMLKPSGQPTGVVTDEDRQYSLDGIDYEFPSDIPPVRYIRFKTLEVWNGANITIVQLDLWGDGGK